MKKLLLVFTMMMSFTSIYAQYTWDITVEKKKDYSDYGTRYQSLDMGSSRSVPDPYEINRMNRELTREIDEVFAAKRKAHEEAMKVISENIQLFEGVNIANKLSSSIRAKVITRNNGSVDIMCMGIKNGQTWKPCSKPIVSLQKMYNNAKSESEKSMILDLMDLGNYLLDTGNEMFVFK